VRVTRLAAGRGHEGRNAEEGLQGVQIKCKLWIGHILMKTQSFGKFSFVVHELPEFRVDSWKKSDLHCTK
jgi:hypothetical protein